MFASYRERIDIFSENKKVGHSVGLYAKRRFKFIFKIIYLLIDLCFRPYRQYMFRSITYIRGILRRDRTMFRHLDSHMVISSLNCIVLACFSTRPDMVGTGKVEKVLDPVHLPVE